MRCPRLLPLLLLALTASLLAQSNSSSSLSQPLLPKSAKLTDLSENELKTQRELLQGYGKLPLSFEVNQGQTNGRVKFLSRGSGFTLFLTGDEAVFALRGSKPTGDNSPADRSMQTSPPVPTTDAVLQMKLLRANPAAKASGADELPGKSNYFVGNDPKKWQANVRQYGKVRYGSIYPGIDLVYYGNQRELEYDFVLQPGADPGQIQLGIDGVSKLRLDQGDLVMSGSGGEVHLRRPHIYQEANGRRREVRGRYVLKSKNEVGFQIDSYDHARTLVIDPVLAYSTYLGGSADDGGLRIAVDSTGNAYVTGPTDSFDFPTANAIQPSAPGGGGDVFVTKLNPDGSALIYSTYLGGSGFDNGLGIAVDSVGDAYVTGWTESPDFPTANAIQPGLHSANGDAFVTKISAAGSALIYSSYLGGSGADISLGIAVDSAGDAYVTGWTESTDFPTANAIQPVNSGNKDTFVTKINPTGSALVFSTYLGGTSGDWGSGIAVDAGRNVYVTGWTDSTDFPTANAIQPANSGNEDGFVTKINAAGSALIYSTYLGGSDLEWSRGIAVDSAGDAYVTGTTFSTDFPTANAIQPSNHGGFNHEDAFVTKINATGSALVFSTYLGGTADDSGYGIAVDAAGNAYVTGVTQSTDFPLANAVQPAYGGNEDVFVTEINAAGSALAFSTYLGGNMSDLGYGIAVDTAKSTYVTGWTYSKNFPKSLLAFQQSKTGRTKFSDAFVAKIATQINMSVSPLKLALGKVTVGSTSKAKKVVLTNTGASALTINRIYIAGANAGDFAETNTCGAGIAAGGTCTVSVTFTPTAIGLRKAVLGISDSDASSPQAVPLTGTGD
jgi:hypothetical protein